MLLLVQVVFEVIDPLTETTVGSEGPIVEPLSSFDEQLNKAIVVRTEKAKIDFFIILIFF